MIDLFTVKRNGTYTFVQATMPPVDGSWLCSETAGLFVRGYSYNVAAQVATRDNEIQDAIIVERIQPTVKTVFDYINNPFYASRSLQQSRTFAADRAMDSFFPAQLAIKWNNFVSDTSSYTFLNGLVSGVNERTTFEVGDLINIEGSIRNNVTGYVTVKTDTTITVDNADLRNTIENAVIFVSDVPRQVEQIISTMIHWDIYSRELSDKESETIGNYSYKNAVSDLNGIEYPTSLTKGLEVYRKVNYVA